MIQIYSSAGVEKLFISVSDNDENNFISYIYMYTIYRLKLKFELGKLRKFEELERKKNLKIRGKITIPFSSLFKYHKLLWFYSNLSTLIR